MLSERLKEEIRQHGSLTVEYFMTTCLHDEHDGYYRRGNVLGADGDFITAPEISQVFGEIIGLWCAVVWQQMGRPDKVHLVEFGPGRGTLMADALRAARPVTGFYGALTVHMIETSAALQAVQRKRLEAHNNVLYSAEWPDPGTMEAGPVIMIGNEFLDALPIEQLTYHDGAWRQRGVGLDDNNAFCFVAGREPLFWPGVQAAPQEGDVFETCGAFQDIAFLLDQFAQRGPLAALFLDYGHAVSGYGDTLQGVKAHRYVSPLEAPGETDLTAQVDFEAFAQALDGPGLTVEPVVTQAEFLGVLGVIQRASKLMAANPLRAGEVEASVTRLLAPNGMGTRFKAIGVRSAALPPLPGFAMYGAPLAGTP